VLIIVIQSTLFRAFALLRRIDRVAARRALAFRSIASSHALIHTPLTRSFEYSLYSSIASSVGHLQSYRLINTRTLTASLIHRSPRTHNLTHVDPSAPLFNRIRVIMSLAPCFEDRIDAATQLADKLSEYEHRGDVVVVGLPRGGVPMAALIAERLQAPLEIVVPRKIGHPAHPEFAIGALTEDGQVIWNVDFADPQSASRYGITHKSEAVQHVVEQEKMEAQRRIREYRGSRAQVSFQHKTVILVDDGVATGATIKAAIRSLRAQQADKVVCAVPVGPPDAVHQLEALCDQVICLSIPHEFHAVGAFYEHFDQTEDAEVIQCLSQAAQRIDQDFAKQQAQAQAQAEEEKKQSSDSFAQAKLDMRAGEKKGELSKYQSSKGDQTAESSASSKPGKSEGGECNKNETVTQS